MENRDKHLKNASLVMKVTGWLCLVGLPLAAVLELALWKWHPGNFEDNCQVTK